MDDYIRQYERDLKMRMDSPSFTEAWSAYAEANEWFDGEQEITESAKRRFRVTWTVRPNSEPRWV